VERPIVKESSRDHFIWSMSCSELVGRDAGDYFFANLNIEVDFVLLRTDNELFWGGLLYLFIIIIFHYKIIHRD
jgi:hypothetical protein